MKEKTPALKAQFTVPSINVRSIEARFQRLILLTIGFPGALPKAGIDLAPLAHNQAATAA
jgi:hypothetical protein